MPGKSLPHTKQTATSADLEWGSDSLSRIYKAMTPGQEDADIFFPKEHTMSIPTFREYLQESNRQEALLLEGPAADFEQYICDAWNHMYGPARLRLKGKDPAGKNLIPGSSSDVKKQALGVYTPTWEVPNNARPPDQAAAISIARALKKRDRLFIGNLLKRTPDGRLTRQYTAAGGTNPTSKTDILLVKPGSGTATEYRYSLKVAPAALMSGLWGDANAVFQIAQQKYTAAGGTVDVSEISKTLSDALDKIHIPDGLAGSSDAAEYLDTKHMTKPSSANKKNEPRGPSGYNIIKTGRRKGKEAQGTLDYLVTIGVMTRDGTLVAPAQRSAKFKKLPADMQTFLDTVALREVGLKGKLQQEMKKAFDNNTDFRAQFVYEAASGHGKFGKKAPQTANRFLKFTTSGTLEDTSTFASAKSPKIVSIAENIRFRFRWKHRQGALAIDMLKNEEVHEPTYQDMLAEHWGMLETTMLNEGWFSDIKTSAKAIWNKFKSWITNFIRAVLQKLHAAATKGYQAVMDFLGFEIAHATLERDVPV